MFRGFYLPSVHSVSLCVVLDTFNTLGSLIKACPRIPKCQDLKQALTFFFARSAQDLVATFLLTVKTTSPLKNIYNDWAFDSFLRCRPKDSFSAFRTIYSEPNGITHIPFSDADWITHVWFSYWNFFYLFLSYFITFLIKWIIWSVFKVLFRGIGASESVALNID